MTSIRRFLTPIFLFVAIPASADILAFRGSPGKPGSGKHIVLLAGDEEYRSEESCPMLAKILSTHHGFDTTVLFSSDKEGGYIDPNQQKNIPGTKAIASADLIMLGLRFRNLPDDQLQPIADYLNAGKPVFGFRTSTHGFKTGGNKLGGIDWDKFGPNILGEGWAGHYGKHAVQGARGVAHEKHADHPILKGVTDVFAESDVYGVKRVNDGNAKILMTGVVTEALVPESSDVKGKEPQPAVWLREYTTPKGGRGAAVCSTFGSSCDLDNEGLRRLFVNVAYYLTGVDVPEKADVSYIDPFEPSRYQFIKANSGHFKKLNLKPADFGVGKQPSTGNPAADLIEPNRKAWEKKKG